MSDLTLKMLPALMVAITAAAVTQPAFGGLSLPTHQIDITENSSISLSVTYDGTDITATGVINTSPDQWTLTFATGIQFTGFNTIGGSIGWVEPENSANGNILSSPSGDNQIFVMSDALGHPFNTLDGATVGVTFIDPSAALAVAAITFHDNAATAEAAVPDTGTTFTLFGLSLTGLGFLRRKLC